MKRIRLLLTISSPLVSILLPVKLRSFKAERYLIFKPMSHWKELSCHRPLVQSFVQFLFARALKNDLLITFHEGLFLYYEHQAWLSPKFGGKNYFVIYFYVKIEVSCPRAELPPVQVSCALGVLEICFKLYLI